MDSLADNGKQSTSSESLNGRRAKISRVKLGVEEQKDVTFSKVSLCVWFAGGCALSPLRMWVSRSQLTIYGWRLMECILTRWASVVQSISHNCENDVFVLRDRDLVNFSGTWNVRDSFFFSTKRDTMTFSFDIISVVLEYLKTVTKQSYAIITFHFRRTRWSWLYLKTLMSDDPVWVSGQ